jgi:NADPH:quinone reductase-like Zn-dependent oxidoreductase
MKAAVYSRFGPPDVLHLEEVETPTPGDQEVLVKVHAASLNRADGHLLAGNSFLIRLMMAGLFRPRNRILGADIAGTVEAVGKKVKRFKQGDAVFGDLSRSGWGGFAEYACVAEGALAPMPARLSFEQAAAAPLAGVAALQGLRNKGRIRSGHKVLVNGASGGVGSFAVQIAKALGAEVTGVCGSRNLEMVRSIGADHVIDYTREDFTKQDRTYDLVFDTAAQHSPAEYRRILNPGGTYVLVGGSRFNFMAKPDQQDLLFLGELLEAGKVKPVVDRRFGLNEISEAFRYLEEGYPRGKIVIAVQV